MSPEQLTVVWHCACMCNWAPLVREQLDLAARVGLTRMVYTQVGPGLLEVERFAAERGVNLSLHRSDPNTNHYETFAMLAIEELAWKGDGCVLYWHTKGVSVPGSDVHRRWRRLMEREVVEKWREHLPFMATHDVCGVGWGYNFSAPHFPGNFWLARNDWIRKLPAYAPYHGRLGLTRFTCETWIGAAPGPRVRSLLCQNLGWNEIVARYMP